MHEIWSGGGSGPSASARANAGNTKSYFDILGDRFKSASAAGVYRDIDNAFSAGGQDGNGSPQSATVSNSGLTSAKKVRIPHRSGGSGGSGGSKSTSAMQEFHYYEAPLAKMYGFSPETAYQEALANTAIRREMNDMRKAGLNPSVIYGSHNSSGADSGIIPRQTSSGSGGGGGGSRRRSGRSNSGKYLFSGGAYYGIMTVAGTVAAIATKSVGAGMAAAGMAGTAMKALNGIFKKK